MDVGASLVAHDQAAKAMEPREGAFDDPAGHAQSTIMRRAAAREHCEDAFGAQPIAMRLRVIPAVALQHIGATARSTPSPPNGREGPDQRIELRDVVDVRGADLSYQGDATRIDDDVVFRAFLTAIGWVRSSFFPPRNARNEALSTTAQRRSRRPRRRSSASKVSCTRRQTPARCQRTKRRQQLLPDPQPISFGSICHGIPLRSTNRMPVKAARFEIGGRPIGFRMSFGNKGSIRAHNSSSRIRPDRRMADRTKTAAPVQALGH